MAVGRVGEVTRRLGKGRARLFGGDEKRGDVFQGQLEQHVDDLVGMLRLYRLSQTRRLSGKAGGARLCPTPSHHAMHPAMQHAMRCVMHGVMHHILHLGHVARPFLALRGA